MSSVSVLARASFRSLSKAAARRRIAARCAGGVADQEGNAVAAEAMQALMSAGEEVWTSARGRPVVGEME